MEFEFNNQLTPQNQIEIENIGSFALDAADELGIHYYYLVKTMIGQSIVASCGPVVPDIESLPSGFCINLYRTEYNEGRLIKFINLFLNDKYKKIVTAIEIDIEEAIEQFRDVKEYLRNLSAETF